jgi:hypothetical protein
MKKVFAFLVPAAILAGCVRPEGLGQLPDTYEVCAMEAAKLREVRTGMDEAQVTRLMGPSTLRIFNGERYEHEPRPHLRSVRKLANGWDVVVHYYRARVMHHDGDCSLDETEAVVFVNGKVDSVMHGDHVEAFLRKF